MRGFILPLWFIAVALFATACDASQALLIRSDAPAAETLPPIADMAECPVTRPPATPFVPPEPWPAQPPDPERFWFGEAGLWTALPRSGSWRQLALGEKFWWWSQAFDVHEDETPDLTVTARRLGGDAPPFHVTGATNGHHPSIHWAMLIGVELPSPGCWEFTGHYEGEQISFVVWVPAE